MAALYGGVVSFISLLFEYIDTAFPNPVRDSYYYYDAYASNISYETASLIVLTPVFMILMRLIRRDIQVDSSRGETWIRRWALFLTVFLAAVAMVVDLIVALTTFLQGEEVTVAFLLKVLAVLLVAGAGFIHFYSDIRGYWQREPMKARMVNYAVGVLVLVTILAGFFIVGTPQQIRRMKQDAIRVQDLQSIQWQVLDFWQQRERIPMTLEEMKDPISNNVIPVDPRTGKTYEYKKTGDMSFELCATFADEGGTIPAIERYSEPAGLLEDNWQHEAGNVCFSRIIDPEKYPPYNKTR